jgi:hypothetical protein
MTTNQTNESDKAAALAAALEQARRSFRLETFETRNSDRLDFWPMHVATLRDAVTAAFEAGFAAGAKGK